MWKKSPRSDLPGADLPAPAASGTRIQPPAQPKPWHLPSQPGSTCSVCRNTGESQQAEIIQLDFQLISKGMQLASNNCTSCSTGRSMWYRMNEIGPKLNYLVFYAKAGKAMSTRDSKSFTINGDTQPLGVYHTKKNTAGVLLPIQAEIFADTLPIPGLCRMAKVLSHGMQISRRSFDPWSHLQSV